MSWDRELGRGQAIHDFLGHNKEFEFNSKKIWGYFRVLVGKMT